MFMLIYYNTSTHLPDLSVNVTNAITGRLQLFLFTFASVYNILALHPDLVTTSNAGSLLYLLIENLFIYQFDEVCLSSSALSMKIVFSNSTGQKYMSMIPWLLQVTLSLPESMNTGKSVGFLLDSSANALTSNSIFTTVDIILATVGEVLDVPHV